MGNDLDKLALAAEAGRLSGIYLRVVMVAKARRIDFEAAGRGAVAKGLITRWDWEMIRDAVGGR